MKKKITITLNTEIKEEREAYELLKSKGRSLSKFVCDKVLGSKKEQEESLGDEFIDRFIERLEKKGITIKEQEKTERNKEPLEYKKKNRAESSDAKETAAEEDNTKEQSQLDTDMMLNGLNAFM